ncbi:Endonuclease/Exonuclease/phosphatase family protein [Spironucleus salmonicida]|uniref:DNA repair nuclease/redox regulator APEX1 n=1 Tax=Spironucleus salmonicida TaxID=348837 RepID=V6LKT4_9EUKA|nr:Endonuclease/Exonuclease/phosphatase family protein [Spironucleus salmonicida]|eukprot:EST45162.1 Endonuclease/Exonuclease/phosphatase family protein [Spironucleus salmonicida]
MPPKKQSMKPQKEVIVSYSPCTIDTEQYKDVSQYKIICLNTNGIRAALKKGLVGYIMNNNPDIFCISETKVGVNKIQSFINDAVPDYPQLFNNYNFIFSSATNKEGYSGTGVFIRKNIQIISYETSCLHLTPQSLINLEGRYINIQTLHFNLVSVYVPNSGRGGGISFLPERMDYEDEIRFLLKQKQKEKPLIYCGDLNSIRSEIDIHNFKSNFGSPGATQEEMDAIEKLITELKLTDSFRKVNGEKIKYSWFSNFGNSRAKKQGWRIDYFLVDEQIQEFITGADIDDDCQFLSDHVPIKLELKFE